MKKLITFFITIGLLLTTFGTASAFFQGFETNNDGWDVFGGSLDASRVSSGNNGINSASGSFHAEGVYPATNWGGYKTVFPSGGYSTSVDIYLDTQLNTNDLRFDWSSAINKPDGLHRRDFVFNAGFYNDLSGPNGFVISAGNNAGRSNSYPKNPGHDPFSIFTSGWYTFEHVFYDNGSGQLAVDMSIYDISNTSLNTWTLSDATDIIGTTVGGNTYGWFANNELPVLAFDNSELSTGAPAPIPEPTTWLLFGTGLLGLVGFGRKRFMKTS